MLAIIIGVGFFLKLAFDRNWLGPSARVLLGIAGGFALLGGGFYWRMKYPTFSQALSGGGIGLLYLSIFAAFAFFNLIGFLPAVILWLLISAISAFLALRQNSMALAILGIIGAFVAPFMFTVTAVQSPPNLWLLTYVVIVDLGVLWLSTSRTWRWFNWLALIGSFGVYGVWCGQFNGRATLGEAITGATIIFIIFGSVTTLFHIIRRQPPEASDYSLMITNAGAYFGIIYGLIMDEYFAWLGGFSLLLAFFYGGLSYTSFRRGVERLPLFTLGISLIFLTVAIPIQLGDKSWTTIAWAAQAAVLVWLSFKTRMSSLRSFGYLTFCLMTIRLLVFDTQVDIHTFKPVFNDRVLSFLVSIAATYSSAYFIWRSRDSLLGWEKSLWSIYPVFLVSANFFSIWIIAAESIGYTLVPFITPHQELVIVYPVILAGVTVLYHLIWRRLPEVFDIVSLVLNAVVYFILSGIVWKFLHAWMGTFYFALALFHACLAYFSARKGTGYSRLNIFATGIAILFFTVAISVQLKDTAWTTVMWAAQGTILMLISFRSRSLQFRIYSYIVFFLAGDRLIFFDTTVNLRSFTPVLNERVLAYLVSIAAVYVAGYLVRRNKNSLTTLEKNMGSIYPIFFVFANFFSIWLLSAEVWGYFSKQLVGLSLTTALATGLRSAQNLSLTGLWAIYAAIASITGIMKQWRGLRIGALMLLAVAIAKVFVYDVFALKQIYRIIAFIGLGILLLISGYLYQRYSQRIKGFITKK